MNNNQQGHPLLDQDIVHYTQSTLTPATLWATPLEFECHKQTRGGERRGDPEPQQTNETNNTTGHVVPEREIIKDNSSEDGKETQEAGTATATTMTSRKTQLTYGPRDNTKWITKLPSFCLPPERSVGP